MGCEACKIEEGLGKEFFSAQSSIEDNQAPKRNNGILKLKEKDIWCDNITIPGIPGQFFWDHTQHIEHPCFAQIKKDIPRSFPNTKFFNQKSNINRFQLLLNKFALYFPKLGYTQGLNFVAGYILIAGFTDSKAFQILCSLMLHEKMLLLGLYEDSFPLNRLYCSIFWQLLEKRLPKTANKLRIAKVPDQSWIFQWFMSFYLYSFPVEFVKRFIDYIICKKQFAIVTIAVGIINCLKQDISEMQDPDQFDFFEFFDKLKSLEFCDAKINIDKVINYANSFTKLQITEALSQTKMKNNIYYVYFLKQKQRQEIWNSIVEKLSHQRKIFRMNPSSPQYMRDQSAVEHLQRFLLKKSQLYRSRTDSRFSSQFSSQIRTSNFTVNLDPINEIMSSQSEKLSHFYKQPKEGIRQTEADGGTISQESRRYMHKKN